MRGIRRHMLVLAGVFLLAAGYLASRFVFGELASAQPKTMVFIPKTIDQRIEFWQVMKQGVFAAAKEYNVDVQVLGTETESDVDGQIRLLETTIKAKPKAIIFAANDYQRLAPVAQKAVQTGIKLITVDSGVKDVASTSFIATDNYAAGLKAGKAIGGRMENGDAVAIISFVKGSATAMEREQGVRDSFKDRSGVQLLDTYYCDASEEKAYEITKRLLQSEPRIRGIIGLNEPSAVGAAKAVRDLSSRVKLVGFDSSMDEIALIEDGVIQATIVQKPFNMGYLAVETAMKAWRGETASPTIDTGSEVITVDNMYEKENQKLLFPFVEK
ncbi:substrate-binding domain-containing protein [Paenibacillus cremeus]|uniref:Substrate-binding domain-containing protein n=1 Tax=Paenibacillus cremeus TaxID=2163881 RepID=A0A559K7P6_9BACL|nr:substrate-binding domain-containing protein [Paenibacillus cremeus]TVY08147.1 substrate-binding domain-containing protein [Paenibacillus cremeus]